MRPGRIKHKARARHRRVAATCAGVSALTVLGGTAAAYATNGGQYDPHPESARLDNGGDASLHVDQGQYTDTYQLAGANTGANDALGITANINLGRQDCTTNLSGGDLTKVDDENTAGNNGGNCSNDASQKNFGQAKALVDTGDASAPNSSETTVNQKNQGDSSVNNSANDNTLSADDGPASLTNGGDAHLYVDQNSSVGTYQGAFANTGHNTAIAAVIGINAGSQTGTTNVSGGNINCGDDNNQAGNTGGNATNHAAQQNNGTATASIKTGNATASNSSTTTVNQTNTGNASSTNTANGNNVTSD